MILYKRFLGLCLAAFCVVELWSDRAIAQYQRVWEVNGWDDRRDFASDIAVGPDGGLYFGGSTADIYGSSSSLYEGGIAAKYDARGNRVWLSNAYGSRSLDHVMDVAVDGSGSVYIAGETYRYASGAEAFLVKFSHAGTRIWERHLGTRDNEFGMSLAVDGHGSVYVGGATTGDLVGGGKHGYDPFFAKYSSTGTLLWLQQYADPTLNPYPVSMSISPGHGIYLGFGGTVDGGLARLDDAGHFQWFERPNYSLTETKHTDIYGIESDADGNVFAVGISNFTNLNGLFVGARAVLAKHDLNGALLWSHLLPTFSNSTAQDVALDSEGHIYICGGTNRFEGGIDSGDTDAFWAKFSPAGELIWFEQWGTNYSESATGLAVDSAGRVFVVTNQYRDSDEYYLADSDVLIVRYDPIPEPRSACIAGILLLSTAIAGRVRLHTLRTITNRCVASA